MSKGHGGVRPGAGRPKGSTNRRTGDVQQRLDALECDPVEGLGRIAKQAEEQGDLGLAMHCYKALMPYIAPKRQSIALERNEGDEAIARMILRARHRRQEQVQAELRSA